MAHKHPDTNPEDTTNVSVEHATEAKVTPASEQATSAGMETAAKSESVETGEEAFKRAEISLPGAIITAAIIIALGLIFS
jgi:hypothetical protein